ncbi:bacterial transferase hexapeptide domain-containing protein [Chryseobacterium sp. StRB126]|uniref:serine O-acetyltransferase n=1 Tax=Chryseobacterium sp. StRB126 TaxID=878220 RepID=UPI0004E98819|nr:serine acetyltransferase [Chryseobacterium sp. StRB126]BAP33037.1 bacterial transferase hexapeptide domain-containing protein [Chryseobacterium sp. StRB126]
MNRKKIIKYIKSDLYRYTGNYSLRSFLIQYLINRGFNYSVWMRLCQHRNPLFHKICFVILNFKRIRYRIDISHKTKIGYGFYLGHSGPLVINPTTIIGNNVNLSQYVSIGANENNAAVIGDNVYIGPNVCIIENVKIGSNSTIGAGSVVIKDIPENATAAGNYAKVLNFNNPGRYVNNRFEN